MKSDLLIIIVCGSVLLDVIKARHISLDELYIQEDEELSTGLYGETDEDNEDWVREAILDVAYYIRSHKFNNYDRRFMNESNKILNLFESFPKAFKALHWEVNKYCVKGFLKCLKYIRKKIKESDLQRRQDTKIIMKENKWRLPENFNAINVADVECERLLQADYKNPVPFQSPLERFHWTITASYFMCWFTMQEHPSLSLFEEKCDNMANCLDSKIQTDFIADPRSNNDYPYQCSLYSFCPDICCPLRKVSNLLECLNSPFNPCNQEHTRNFTCTLDRRKNTDLTSIILNKWNYSCECTDGILSEWSPMFGMCTDVNECEIYNNPCNKSTEECVNKKGGFDCICKADYTWDSTKNLCYQIPIFNESIKRLTAPAKSYTSIWRSEVGFSIIKGIFMYLFPNNKEEDEDDLLKHH